MDIIEGRGVNAFVRDPHAYEKVWSCYKLGRAGLTLIQRKQDNVASNSKKAMMRALATGNTGFTASPGRDTYDASDIKHEPGSSQTTLKLETHGSRPHREGSLVLDPPRNTKRKRPSEANRARKMLASTHGSSPMQRGSQQGRDTGHGTASQRRLPLDPSQTAQGHTRPVRSARGFGQHYSSHHDNSQLDGADSGHDEQVAAGQDHHWLTGGLDGCSDLGYYSNDE